MLIAPAERDHHAAALVQVRYVAFGRIHERRGVEMAIMMLDELRNRSALDRHLIFS